MTFTAITGLLLVAVPIAFNATFFLLQRAFEYPDILRKPTDYILQRFKEGGAPLRRLWYAFALSAVWTILLCLAVVQTDVVNPLFGWLGIVPAIWESAIGHERAAASRRLGVPNS